MKQILLLLLLLLPCFAMAQYQGNANQKITLGEQTTADGLVYRGVENDTALITPRSDTSAYIILDTVNNKFYNYNRTTNVWSLAGGGVSVSSFSAGTTGLTPNTATTGAVTLNGTLAVANGGTGTTTMPDGYILHGDGTSIDTSIGLFYDRGNRRLGVNITVPVNTVHINGATTFSTSNINGAITNDILHYNGVNALSQTYRVYGSGTAGTLFNNPVAGNSFMWTASNRSPAANFIIGNLEGANLIFGTSNAERMRILSGGNVGIGTTSPAQVLHVVGNARITAVAAGTFGNHLNITSDGTLTTATSDEKYKYNILPLSYGLNTILQLKPVNFNWIDGEENDLGFIAQDVAEIIPEAVSTNWNSDLLFRYESLIPILTKAIQEQQALIKALEQRILNLENK